MACSDNTVRAGLTRKYIDVNTLCDMLNYHPAPPSSKIFASVVDPSDPCVHLYNPPVADFSVMKIQVGSSNLFILVFRKWFSKSCFYCSRSCWLHSGTCKWAGLAHHKVVTCCRSKIVTFIRHLKAITFIRHCRKVVVVVLTRSEELSSSCAGFCWDWLYRLQILLINLLLASENIPYLCRFPSQWRSTSLLLSTVLASSWSSKVMPWQLLLLPSLTSQWGGAPCCSFQPMRACYCKSHLQGSRCFGLAASCRSCVLSGSGLFEEQNLIPDFLQLWPATVWLWFSDEGSSRFLVLVLVLICLQNQ